MYWNVTLLVPSLWDGDSISNVHTSWIVLALLSAVQNSLGNYYHYEFIKIVCKKLGNVLKCNVSGAFALLLFVDFKFVNYFKKNIYMWVF